MMLRITIMILEFVIENYRIIAVVLTLIGVVFCTYALIKQIENNKNKNAVIKPSAGITNISIPNHENQILHNNNTGNPDITNINYPNNKRKKYGHNIWGWDWIYYNSFLLVTFVMLFLIIGIILL